MKSVGFIFALVILFSGHFSTISGEILTSDKHYSHPTSHSNIEAELNEAMMMITTMMTTMMMEMMMMAMTMTMIVANKDLHQTFL